MSPQDDLKIFPLQDPKANVPLLPQSDKTTPLETLSPRMSPQDDFKFSPLLSKRTQEVYQVPKAPPKRHQDLFPKRSGPLKTPLPLKAPLTTHFHSRRPQALPSTLETKSKAPYFLQSDLKT
ncbi:hypothetical protein H2248_002666 [Termitomyces sp. 'cryptogamus']|nr:hypothetical protein H2248_002666 [Termitomyces sp. 'cryptogamus']